MAVTQNLGWSPANPYQAKEDNREVEITTLLDLLHKVDERIDSKFLEL